MLLTTCCLLQLPMAGPTTCTPTRILHSVSSMVTGRFDPRAQKHIAAFYLTSLSRNKIVTIAVFL